LLIHWRDAGNARQLGDPLLPRPSGHQRLRSEGRLKSIELAAANEQEATRRDLKPAFGIADCALPKTHQGLLHVVAVQPTNIDNCLSGRLDVEIARAQQLQ